MKNDDAAHLIQALADVLVSLYKSTDLPTYDPDEVEKLIAEGKRWRLERELDEKTHTPQTSDPQGIDKGFLATKGTLAVNEQGALGIVTTNTKNVHNFYEGVCLLTGQTWTSWRPTFVGKLAEFFDQDPASNNNFREWVDRATGKPQ